MGVVDIRIQSVSRRPNQPDRLIWHTDIASEGEADKYTTRLVLSRKPASSDEQVPGDSIASTLVRYADAYSDSPRFAEQARRMQSPYASVRAEWSAWQYRRYTDTVARRVTGYASRHPALAQRPGPTDQLPLLPFSQLRRATGTDWPAAGSPLRSPWRPLPGRGTRRASLTNNASSDHVAGPPVTPRRPHPSGPSTMIGMVRCRNLMDSIWHVHRGSIPGDILEAGVWRGGAGALAVASLQWLWEHECWGEQAQPSRCSVLASRAVWLADSFDGLPPPQGPEDAVATAQWDKLDYVRASMEQVREAVRSTLEWARIGSRSRARTRQLQAASGGGADADGRGKASGAHTVPARAITGLFRDSLAPWLQGEQGEVLWPAGSGSSTCSGRTSTLGGSGVGCQLALQGATNRTIAVLRVDADMYSGTMDVLSLLYDRVSPGGIVIVDDWAVWEAQRATLDFRERIGLGGENGVQAPLIILEDMQGAWWRKP